MMYGISTFPGGFIRSQNIQHALATVANGNADPEAVSHIQAIEHIEARGLSRSNEDFDVLSSALDCLSRRGVSPDSLAEPFELRNVPPVSRERFEDSRHRQLPMFTGLSCEPGQLDLIPDLDVKE